MRLKLNPEIDACLYNLLTEAIKESGVKLSVDEYMEQYLTAYFKSFRAFYPPGASRETLVTFIKGVEEWKGRLATIGGGDESALDNTFKPY